MKHLKVLLLLAATPSLNGCLLLAAGAGAEGAYVATQDRGAGDTISDQRITAEIKSRFIAEPGIAALRINVDTYKAIVTLTGEVTSPTEAQRAVAIARTVSGVSEVVSKLNIPVA